MLKSRIFCRLDSARESDLQNLVAELALLKEVNKERHPNVIRLIGGCSIEGIGIMDTVF